MSIVQSRRGMMIGAGGLALGSVAGALAAVPEQVVNIGFAGGFGNKTQTNLSFSARDGALLAIDDANRRNLVIDGKIARFALLLVDDQSEPNFARLTANSFIASNVCGVIGHHTTDTSVAATPAYAEVGIPLISPTSSGRILTSRGYHNVFQLLGHDGVGSGYLADSAATIARVRRVAILDNATALGLALADGFAAKARALGLEVVAHESLNGKSSEFSGVLTRIKAANPDLLFFTTVGPTVSALLQNVKRMNLGCKLLATGGGVNLEFPASGLYPAGSYVLMQGLPVDKRPGYAEFEKSYRRKFESALSAYTLFAYDAVGLLVEAMRRTNSTDPRLLTAELHKMQYKGISGLISFAADGSRINPPYTLYHTAAGQWQAVKIYGE